MTQKYNPTKSEIIAQAWFFSCDAPDTNETAYEIDRLARMIDDIMGGKEPEWKVVKHYLREETYE